MVIELNVNGIVEKIEIGKEVEEKLKKIAQERNIDFDTLVEILLRNACAEVEADV